ncbi:MAG: response regulator, partial [Planctomycetota bacterium]
ADFHGDGTIMVVDDEEAVREVAGRMLEEFGFDVVTAESGATAVEEYRHRKDEIDGVLLDLTMPKMSGEQTLRALHEIRSDLPVILSSGYSEHDAVRRLTTDRLASFLQKPYTADGLIEKIREVFEVHAAPQQADAEDSAAPPEATPSDEDSRPVAR